METYTAVFDGRAFIPDEPVDLPPQSRVEIVVRTGTEARGAALDALFKRARREGGIDWSQLDRGELYP